MQSVTHLSADPVSAVTSSIPALFHTFVDIDLEIIPTIILLLPLTQEVLLSVTSRNMCMKFHVYRLVKLAQKKVWLYELTIWT